VGEASEKIGLGKRVNILRKPSKKELFYLLFVLALYATGIIYAYSHDLSIGALFKYGLLQPGGITGEAARLGCSLR